LRIFLLVLLIPRFGFAGPALAFVCAETTIVGIWIFQLKRLGFPANLGNVIWRPLAGGFAMTIVLFIGSEGRFLWQITAAVVSVVVYAAVLLALKTFSVEEIHHAREGIAFVSPFIESWMKKLKRNT
jgi:O-antigen/teichoic acid export membrane protein